MAHDGDSTSSSSPSFHEIERLSTSSIEIEIPMSTDDLDPDAAASIDNLLAMTGETWDVEEQVRTLKLASVDRNGVPRAADSGPRSEGKAHVMAPTPFDLGAPSPSSPPPLPTRSKPPPPLPKSGSKGPPPLPRSSERGSLAPPPLSSAASLAATEPLAPGPLLDLLEARAAKLKDGDDRVALARTHVEIAVVNEIVADESRVIAEAEAALAIDPTLAAAHAILRRRTHARSALPAMLVHLDHELAAATAEAAAIDLIVEKARLLGAIGDDANGLRAAWEQALTRAPNHAAAMKGLEAELANRARGDSHEAHDALATHLGRMADAYASEPRLAAWLHVERAKILESKLLRFDAARGALERAVKLDPSVGLARNAYVMHVASHGDFATLASLLDEEALLETNPTRSARLELDAACIAFGRLKDNPRAIALLERASVRAPSTPSVDRRVLDELVRLYETAGQWPEAARARRARLRFVTDPASLGYELRTLAAIHERLKDYATAIEDVQRARTIDSTDPILVDTLDRLLGLAEKSEPRLALWVTEAARTEDGTKRARCLVRAAQIAEVTLGRPADAIRHLRAAWTAAPGDSEVFDALARLLTPAPTPAMMSEARALIELYAQAVQSSHDAARRVAYAEKIALLWEDVVGDAARATRAYEDVLSIEPGRRSAILGLARTAVRAGDDRAIARALLDEAKLAEEGGAILALRVRAATALARVDPARALALVKEVLAQDAAHTAAHALETRLHEEAGRWELVAASLKARIEIGKEPAEKLALWLSLAQVQDARLRAPLDAMSSLKAARALDPTHAVPAAELARVMATTGDDRALRVAVEALAADASTRDERARHWLHAGEIDELRVGDDASAARLYSRALAETPDDDLIAERLARVLARRSATLARDLRVSANFEAPASASAPWYESDDTGAARPSASYAASLRDRVTFLTKRIERASSPLVTRPLSFDLAMLLLELADDLPYATTLLEQIVTDEPGHVAALRSLEAIARRTNAWVPLGRVLAREVDTFVDVRARLGALWNLAELEEWRLPSGDPGATYGRILALDPTDPGALEATVRRELAAARNGDSRARKAAISSLRSLCAFAADDGTRLAIQLRLALLLESSTSDADASGSIAAKEALDRYRAALEIDPLSVTAATGLARLATRWNDAPGAVAAATSLAELAADARARARYLLEASEILLGDETDDRLGGVSERRARAATLLERALEADAESIAVAGRLATLRLENKEADRLVESFRSAIGRAKAADAIVMLGSEIARVARDDLGDLAIAIEAMRRVREAVPQHVPSLLTMAELCIAQRAWPDAVDALEAVASTSRDPAPRLTALFALASVYEKVLSRPEDGERALRFALTIEPSNARALRALLHRLAELQAQKRPGATDRRGEIAALLERLAGVEHEADARGAILLELAEIRVQLGEPAAAERALVDAVADSPSNARAFARLAALFKTHGALGEKSEIDAASYARALGAVIARGQSAGNVDPRWLAALGQLEIDSLARLRDGVSHLERAVQLDPTMHETRFELARAYAEAGSHADATKTLMTMITPAPPPLLAISDPAAALQLLETSLGQQGRAADAIVVSELRATAGDLDAERLTWLQARKLGALDPHHAPLDRATIVSHVVRADKRHVLLDVAAAARGLESKVVRSDLGEHGISAKDRVNARSGHPARAIFDRVAKALEVSDVEFVISPAASRTRVLVQDEPWVVLPKSLADASEARQTVAIARALARVALGVPWRDELPPAHNEALLVAIARQVVPAYGAEELDVLALKIVGQYEPAVAKNIARRHKKSLEELTSKLVSTEGKPPSSDALELELARAELRVAYLVSGDLLAVVEEVRSLDPELGRVEAASDALFAAVLVHPLAGDVVRFALTSEATALRRRIGSAWV